MNVLLNNFDPISLEQMSSVKLMNRTDTKFVTNTLKLCQLLEMAQDDYYVQEIDGERNLEYDTTYFDTMAFDMYNQHQWNHTNRQKIRFRTYCVSGLQFMEVKTKNNHGRTKKKRIELYNSWGIEKIRYNIGTDLRLSKQHNLSIYYRYQDMKHADADDYDPDMHYIGVGYKFKF